jgi:hypothetical protein
MNFAAEKARIREMEKYGVKTTHARNRYQEEWDKAHPGQATIRKVLGTFLMWAAILSPIIVYVKGLINV